MVGVLPFLVGEPTAAIPLWLLGLVVIGPITLLSAGLGRRMGGVAAVRFPAANSGRHGAAWVTAGRVIEPEAHRLAGFRDAQNGMGRKVGWVQSP